GPPHFGDPRTGNSYSDGERGSDGYSGAAGDGRGASPSFATPPAVDRADLSPLEPIAPADGGNGPYGSYGSGAPPAKQGYGPGRADAEIPRGSSGAGGTDGYSTPAANTSSSWAPATVADASRIDPSEAERLLKTIDAAPKSRTLRELLRSVLANAGAAAGREGQSAAAAKIDAQLRLGFVEEAAAFPIPEGLNRESSDWAGFALRRSVAMLALGRGEDACRDARDIIAVADGLPDKDKDLGILLSGYCGALSNTSAAVTLAADVARERSGFDPAGLAGLEAVARGARPRIPTSLKLSPIAYRMLQKAGADPGQLVAAQADAALLAAMPVDGLLPAEARIEAAEKSAASYILTPEMLAKAYGEAPRGTDIEAMPAGRDAETGSPVLRRANLYVAAARQPTPLRKVRLVRAFLDSSAKAGLFEPALEMMSEPVSRIAPVDEIGWFAETAVEALVVGGRIEEARQWLRLAENADPRGAGALAHWAALVDIADPSRSARRGDSLASLERMALRGDFKPAELHRLATVLDALDYQVPIPLWDAASRSPQPTDGYLPPTGVLSELQQAAKSGESAKMILLVANAIGPDGPAGAHMIALGDAIRAFKRAGMEREARRLGVEALFPAWPRSAQG
ncbi:MAG: hypothetical protein KJ587_11040, partial [Alphaproteobacteria bacterium]|nr:hypothetical protein [Alphaproteobacteria bacterium]